MRFRKLTLNRVCALGLASALSLATQVASADDSCAGVALPAQSKEFGETLVRNGMGLREATVFDVDVYVAALYVEHKTRSARDILNPQAPKVIVLRFVRDVSRDEMIDALREALHNNAGTRYAEAQQHLQRFVAKLPKLQKGTELVLAYRPQHGIELTVNGRSLGVDSDDGFGNLVFRAWLGPKPPDADLKAGLLGGKCN